MVPVIAAAQAGIGLGQMLLAASRPKPQRPIYEIPQALKDANRMATTEANATADPMMAAAQDRVKQGTANTLSAQQRASKSSASLLNAAGQAQVVQNQGMNNIAQQGMGLREQRRSRRYSLANAMADAQNKQWELNQYQPYQQNASAVRALYGAGMQNIAGAASTYAASQYGSKNTTDNQAAQYNGTGAYDSPNTYQNMV